MKKLILAVALAAAIIPGAASARSCSEQGQACRSWVASNVPASAQASYNGRCASATKTCRASCKGGNKVFIGVYSGAGGGQSYPVDTCD